MFSVYLICYKPWNYHTSQHNCTLIHRQVKMLFWLSHEFVVTTGELKDCFGDESHRHSGILSVSFLRDFGQQSSPTHTSWLLSGGIASAIFFFWWNQRKSTSSPRQATYPFFVVVFVRYSIILSDGPFLWALALLLIPISERQRASLVCRHANGNWIIPRIWASAQKGICN